MLRLVILSPGMTGRVLDLRAERSTIGRAEDNTFPIVEPSVSSHHCEILLRGQEVVVRDLDSTNGSYINREKVTEKVLKPNQILRLGQIDLRLETDAAPGPGKQQFDRTAVIPGGVKLTELEQGARGTGFETKGFSKKSNRGNLIFLVVGIAIGLLIVGLLLYIASTIRI
jgi:pSer/pThr/pTyr-binding forkhead associated (FHA) protein